MVNIKKIINKDYYIKDYNKWLTKINEFVDNSDASLWLKKRAAGKSWQNELWMAKLAEVGVSQYLSENGYPNVEPDFNIYDKKNKNWDADLVYNHLGYENIHVKSCSQKTQKILSRINEVYSWTFNWSTQGGGGKDLIFKDGGQVALVYVGNVGFNWIRIIGIYDFAKDIEPKLKPPMVERLKAYKKCIYYKDLINESK